ncbi:MAG: hypothetical protein QM756_46125 [Polyangiaceae bacterium]
MVFRNPHVAHAAFALCFGLFAPFAGCSSESSGGDATGGKSSGGASSGTQGTFTVQLTEAAADGSSPARTNVLGIIFDGPSPPTIQLKLDSKNGDCELLVPFSPFCNPACTNAAICTADNTCTPQPKALDVGTVKLTGLGAELTLTPIASNYQSPTLPLPSCAEGSPVAVSADSFSMESKCISPLVLTTAVPVPVASGKAIPLAWTPPGAGAASRIRVHLDIAHHGGKKGEINCDVADTGSFSIPEPLVTKLVSLGLAGFPTIGLERYTSGSAASNANIKLRVSSAIEREVDTGITSCNSDEECNGKTCASDKTCK